MSTKDRIYKKEYAKELFRIGHNDLVAARALAQHAEVRGETVLMMAQQAIEKGLKSVLCYQEKSIPMTHDLYGIVQRLGSDHEPPYTEQLEELTPYATIRRYEEGRFEITAEDIANALTITEAIIKWCEKRIK